MMLTRPLEPLKTRALPNFPACSSSPRWSACPCCYCRRASATSGTATLAEAVCGDQAARLRSVRDRYRDRRRERGIAGGVPSPRRKAVSSIGDRGGAPRQREGRTRLLGTQRSAIEQELHTDHTDIVRRRWRSRSSSPRPSLPLDGAVIATVGAAPSDVPPVATLMAVAAVLLAVPPGPVAVNVTV